MPTYEYQCLNCGNRFDQFQSIAAAPLETCPKCHGKVKRLISAGAGLIFKGSGFYITDYRGSGYKEAAKKDSESTSSSSDSKNGDAKKTESKNTKTDTGSAAKSSD